MVDASLDMSLDERLDCCRSACALAAAVRHLPPPPDPVSVLRALVEARIEFIVVGDFAAMLHGSPIVAFDLEIVCRPDVVATERAREIVRLAGARALAANAPEILVDDILGAALLRDAIGGGLKYADLAPQAISIEVDGRALRVLCLEKIVESMQASIRERDRASVPTHAATLTRLRERARR